MIRKEEWGCALSNDMLPFCKKTAKHSKVFSSWYKINVWANTLTYRKIMPKIMMDIN